MNEQLHENLRRLPGVDRLLRHPRLVAATQRHGLELVKAAAREAIDTARRRLLADGAAGVAASLDEIVDAVERRCQVLAAPTLRAVVNATGILIHTNLGRAPLGPRLLADILPVLSGYCNLELDLATGGRGDRLGHVGELLAAITGAEDALVVNNNAAALVLTLSTLASGREVVVSRGELVEIGGSFRIPEILATSGAVMVEVGTTNPTRLADYARVLGDRTALLLKTHTSNFEIRGFTEAPSLAELVQLGRSHGLPVVYDIGSGLLRKPAGLPLDDEPDVRAALAQGVDLVTFSGDKLLGGPQAGVVAGRRELVARLARAPLMRALRVGKLTIAALTSAARCYLDDRQLSSLPLFSRLETPPEVLRSRAAKLRELFTARAVPATLVESRGRCGGGTLPGLELPSQAVVLGFPEVPRPRRGEVADRLFHLLLDVERPILAVLRQGELVFDVLTLDEADLLHVADTVAINRPLAL